MAVNRFIIGFALGCLFVFGRPAAAAPFEIPAGLPRYDLDIQLHLDQHEAKVRQRVIWTNTHDLPATELVFNVHSHYKLPEGDIGFTAKLLEIMRLPPSEALDTRGHACEIERVTFVDPDGVGRTIDLTSPGGGCQPPLAAAALPHYRADNQTALVIPLSKPVGKGATVTVKLEFTMYLPQKQGRWGQWNGVTFLSNWLPVLAYYDNGGWNPTPFVPWHQPFFNEAGSYYARVTLPCDQKFACTGTVQAVADLGNGMRQVDFHTPAARDFAFLCSARFREYVGESDGVKVRCVAFPEHEYHARAMVRIACQAIATYTRWFGPYPYPEFTIVESYFGWNGNECAGLIMIDERVFGMPHLGTGYVEYLVSHEVCHQWWYNVIGTNGYCETWMDEALATYFSHRMLNERHGTKNSKMLQYPRGLEWLPNIDRDTYRNYGLYGTLGRGEATPTVQPMERFGHTVTLFSMCYDRGSKIVGMIEDRLGEAAFFDFMRTVYRRYYFRILRVADFRRELEAYTGHSWEEFFTQWLYSAGMTDWAVEKVTIKEEKTSAHELRRLRQLAHLSVPVTPCRVTVLLKQKAEYNEQTVLGICLDGSKNYQIRIPILPQVPRLQLEDPPAVVECAPPGNCVRVEVSLPCRPTQIAVDPDQVLVDREPSNNYWKPQFRMRIAPVYTILEDTDLTTAYDRWNLTAGPWVYGTAYDDPWFTRSMMAGFRVGAYRTQQFSGGVYAAYRTDYRDLAFGVDALWDHFPWSHTQVGFNLERSLISIDHGRFNSRGVAFGRYVFDYSSSLYLPPMHYLEGFGAVQNNDLPLARHRPPEAERFDHSTSLGLHYHLDYLTPYWDPEGGFRFDATYANGLPIFGEHQEFNRVSAQFSTVKGVPEGLGWLSDTRVAARLYGAVGWPWNAELFPLGGSSLFRGFDLAERQGSMVWVGSLEWRFPLIKGLHLDCLDHTVSLRNAYGVTFYDVGNAYLRGHALGDVAHAVGGGLAFDVAWFSFVERTIVRLDVAQSLNTSAPLQFNFYFQHPF